MTTPSTRPSPSWTGMIVWTMSFTCSPRSPVIRKRSEEHTSELQSRSDLVCRLLLEKKKKKTEQRVSDARHTKQTCNPTAVGSGGTKVAYLYGTSTEQ